MFLKVGERAKLLESNEKKRDCFFLYTLSIIQIFFGGVVGVGIEKKGTISGGGETEKKLRELKQKLCIAERKDKG